MIRRPPRSTQSRSSAASDVYKRQGLGVALEKMKVPENITVICIGKSTYARLGIIVNTTPAEAGWEGHLT